MLCFWQVSGCLSVDKSAGRWGALCGWGREKPPSPGAGWLGHLWIPGAETALQPLHLGHLREQQPPTYLLPCPAFSSAPVREALTLSLQKPKAGSQRLRRGPREAWSSPRLRGEAARIRLRLWALQRQQHGMWASGGRNAGLGGGEPVLAKRP